jgi:hypothetical protein
MGLGQLQTAAELRLRELYHYQPFEIDWLNQTIEKNIIYLSNPGGFNDPWDCRPHFNSDVNDSEIRKATLYFYYNFHKKYYPDGGKGNIEKTIKELEDNPAKLSALIKKSSEGIAEDIDKHYRVYCLSNKPACPLMWGHYAEKHTGVCLEFKVRNEVFCGALKIKYEENYPPFQLTDNSTETNVKCLTTKSKDWAYEEEYRLIALDKAAKLPSKDMLVTDNNFLRIPENSLHAIIVGCMTSEASKNEIKALIKSSGKSVLFKEVVRIPNKYGLLIKEVIS